MTMKTKSQNHNLDPIFVELREDDNNYGQSKKNERPKSEIKHRRPIKNLTKAWLDHVEDFDEIDDFYGR